MRVASKFARVYARECTNLRVRAQFKGRNLRGAPAQHCGYGSKNSHVTSGILARCRKQSFSGLSAHAWFVTVTLQTYGRVHVFQY